MKCGAMMLVIVPIIDIPELSPIMAANTGRQFVRNSEK